MTTNELKTPPQQSFGPHVRQPRGYRGDPDAHLYAGPTKRSADVNDYTALEAEVAKASEENTKLRAQLDAVLKRERALLWQVKRLEAIVAIDPEEIRLYVAARETRATNITIHTPPSAIDVALEWQRRAVRVADLVADAVAKTTSTVESTTKTGGSR